MFRIRWRYAPFRRTEMFTWCWKPRQTGRWQGTHSDSCSVIITLAVIMKVWHSQLGLQAAGRGLKGLKSHKNPIRNLDEPRQNEFQSFYRNSLHLWTLKLFIVVNLKIWQRPPWFIVFAIHNALVTCINSKTAICKHTLQYIPSGNQTWKWRVPIYRLFSNVN